MSAEAPISAKELALLEMFGGSADPQYVPDSSLFRKGDRVTLADGTLIDSLADKPAGEKDEGMVQSGGARRSRRRQRRSRKTRRARRKTAGRKRSSGGRSKFSFNLRARIRI